MIFASHQVSLRAGETVLAKRKFEWMAAEEGVRIKGYHADNVPFDLQEFRLDIESKQQRLVLSGTGAHHQNEVTERAIPAVVALARAMMLHLILHWPEQADLALWPFALDCAIFVWNRTHWSPNEIFGGTRADPIVLSRLRVCGCPVYVLDRALQDGKKIPQWFPRARRGMFLGFSAKHSSTVGMILNLVTGHMSPQYHVVYDEKFSTVTSTAAHAEALNRVGTGTFTVEEWNDLLVCGYDRHPALDEAVRENLPLPELADKWLSPAKLADRENLQRTRILRTSTTNTSTYGSHGR
jgi:hypothetical protein